MLRSSTISDHFFGLLHFAQSYCYSMLLESHPPFQIFSSSFSLFCVLSHGEFRMIVVAFLRSSTIPVSPPRLLHCYCLWLYPPWQTVHGQMTDAGFPSVWFITISGDTIMSWLGRNSSGNANWSSIIVAGAGSTFTRTWMANRGLAAQLVYVRTLCWAVSIPADFIFN